MTESRPLESKRSAEWLSLVFIVIGVWLAWQCLKEVAADRLPPQLALRIAGTSPRVLSRAAESELAAERFENAEDLARDAIRRSAFDVKAVRVLGLSLAQQPGEARRADELVTLAGNWSLRDDPSHAWLVQTRLNQGNIASAFAHADTLARRREDIYPRLFNLFQTAALLDRRAGGPLVDLLARNPPWRYAFINHLQTSREGLSLAVALAEPLERTPAGRLTDDELFEFYSALIDQGYVPAVADLRRRLNRPPAQPAVFNGSFDEKTAVRPFDWVLSNGPGISTGFATDSVTGQSALRVSYDGFSVATVAEQLVVLRPGRYRLAGEQRSEVGNGDTRLHWSVLCRDGRELGREMPGVQSRDWSGFGFEFEVPATGCDMQWIRLATRAQDRRSDNVIWYDGLVLSVR